MTLNPLYKRAKTGKIQTYNVFVQVVTNGYVIVKMAGQLNGKLTAHKELITKGKQGRTVQQQAEAQALSDWNKKKDQGYKSLDDLGVIQSGNSDMYYTNGEVTATLDVILNKALPEENTDANGQAKPMLAHKYKDHKSKVKFPCYLQPKLDGVRATLVIGEDIKFLSRNGKEYSTLGHIATALKKKGMDGGIFDGEIYSDELTFQEIVSAVKKNNPNTHKLKFRVYDTISKNYHIERLLAVKEFVDKADMGYISSVDTVIVESEDEIKYWFAEYIERGYEGAMIRLHGYPYESGARSHSLLKVTEHDDAEFQIVGCSLFKEQITSYKYLKTFSLTDKEAIDSFTITLKTEEGKEFSAKPMGTRQQRLEYMYNIESMIGQMGTVIHFGWTDDIKPRHPRFKALRNDI